jgi:hypothetical protein
LTKFTIDTGSRGGGATGEPVGEPGCAVRVVARKWPDRPHWEHDARLLGEDEHGVWVGAPAGTSLTRPGRSLVTDQAQVTLIPRSAASMATFYAPGGFSPVDVYVDMTTEPRWSGASTGRATVTAVDLDLDVMRGWTGRVWVDDEDEFAQARARWAYPTELVRLAVTSCEAVHAALDAGRPPYDGSAERWLEAMRTAPRQLTRTGGTP